MFSNKNFYERLQIWKDMRSSLEISPTPIKTLTDFYKQLTLVSMAADPYNAESWPDPWEQLEEDMYCPFTAILAMCYCLRLSDRFSKSKIEIHIGTDNKKEQIVYWVSLDGIQIGLWDTADDLIVISSETHNMTL